MVSYWQKLTGNSVAPVICYPVEALPVPDLALYARARPSAQPRAAIQVPPRDGAADPAPPHPRLFTADKVAPALARGTPYRRETGVAAAFAPGDRVRTRLPARNAFVPGGHTRLPGYAAGQVGTVILGHGAHVLPDANAHGLGECPEPLYTVAFAAADLWGAAEGTGDEVTADLWQSYLEPA